MKNCFLTTIFSVLCVAGVAQNISNTVYFLADNYRGQSDIYEIKFEGADANLYFLASIDEEVQIAYKQKTNTLYAVGAKSNHFRTIDLNSTIPKIGYPIRIHKEMGNISAATFEPCGDLFVGSANQNKIYSINTSNCDVSLYDNYAPIDGGDLAFDQFGNLFLTSNIPTGIYQIFPMEVQRDMFLGGIPSRSTGLARFENGNMLLSESGNSFLEERETQYGELISQIDLYLNGDPFTIHQGDMASGSAIPLDECLSVENVKRNTLVGSESIKLAIYPNPADQKTKITYVSRAKTNLQIEILNMNGKKVRALFTDRVEGSEKISIPFDASSIPNGIYLIRATTPRNITTQKLIITR